ncbi:unnamed protein product [Amoebophrya sp. A25]|nr:unnamed protein product [Amoebophrya sp. A25]|eukprot:GSA25T00009690001.1
MSSTIGGIQMTHRIEKIATGVEENGRGIRVICSRIRVLFFSLLSDTNDRQEHNKHDPRPAQHKLHDVRSLSSCGFGRCCVGDITPDILGGSSKIAASLGQLSSINYPLKLPKAITSTTPHMKIDYQSRCSFRHC